MRQPSPATRLRVANSPPDCNVAAKLTEQPKSGRSHPATQIFGALPTDWTDRPVRPHSELLPAIPNRNCLRNARRDAGQTDGVFAVPRAARFPTPGQSRLVGTASRGVVRDVYEDDAGVDGAAVVAGERHGRARVPPRPAGRGPEVVAPPTPTTAVLTDLFFFFSRLRSVSMHFGGVRDIQLHRAHARQHPPPRRLHAGDHRRRRCAHATASATAAAPVPARAFCARGRAHRGERRLESVHALSGGGAGRRLGLHHQQRRVLSGTIAAQHHRGVSGGATPGAASLCRTRPVPQHTIQESVLHAGGDAHATGSLGHVRREHLPIVLRGQRRASAQRAAD
eukprot:ctg_193.g92